MSGRHTWRRQLAVTAAVALGASACLGGGGATDGGSSSGDGGDGGGGGGTVEIFGAFSGHRGRRPSTSRWPTFEEETGINIEYVPARTSTR